MIDLSIYDLLEGVVDEQEEKLTEFQYVCGCEENATKLGINSIQSMVRSSVIEEQQEESAYSRIGYGKNGLESIKLKNIKFDIDNVINLVSNIPGVIAKEKWAIIMTVLSIISTLKSIKVELSPAMAETILYLHKNDYTRNCGRMIGEDELRNEVIAEMCNDLRNDCSQDEFSAMVSKLVNLNVIKVEDGKIMLMEEVKI